MAAIDGLAPLREVVETHGLNARKSLGQNFLFDLNLTQKIARTAGDLTNTTVIEIGPGPGGLTRALLSLGAKKVIAVERDPRCLPALAEIQAHYPGRLEIIEADALKINLNEIADTQNYKVVANLPYNIGTQLLVNWLLSEPWPPRFTSLTLMFQREVAQRIVASPSSSAYGRLGVLAGWRAHSNIIFDVPKEAFNPPPKVTSSIIHITPNEHPISCNAKTLGHVTQACFGQRRKMLRQSLKQFGGEKMLAEIGIDATRRPETLEVDAFCAIANYLDSKK